MHKKLSKDEHKERKVFTFMPDKFTGRLKIETDITTKGVRF